MRLTYVCQTLSQLPKVAALASHKASPLQLKRHVMLTQQDGMHATQQQRPCNPTMSSSLMQPAQAPPSKLIHLTNLVLHCYSPPLSLLSLQISINTDQNIPTGQCKLLPEPLHLSSVLGCLRLGLLNGLRKHVGDFALGAH